jgi:hypothetical protein
MKRKLTVITLVAVGGVAVGVVPALATLTEVGAQSGTTPASTTGPTGPTGTGTPASAPSCPGTPCLAVSRTTGYQAKVGTQKAPDVVPKAGRIVAWTISLGNPNKKQISFFNTAEGGSAEAGIAVLRGGKQLTYTLVASSPYVALQPYFGKTVEFPLNSTIPVQKGDIIALTVPTWAPALALGFSNATSWRPSRPKKGCNDTTTQTADTSIGNTIQYYCLYRQARLTYSASVISTP